MRCPMPQSEPEEDNSAGKFQSYSEAVGSEPSDRDMPSKTVSTYSTPQDEAAAGDRDKTRSKYLNKKSFVLDLVCCSECDRPRPILFTGEQDMPEEAKIAVSAARTDFQYSCGAPFLPDDHKLDALLFVREKTNCLRAVENTVYGFLEDHPRTDGLFPCSSCGSFHESVVKTGKLAEKRCDTCKAHAG